MEESLQEISEIYQDKVEIQNIQQQDSFVSASSIKLGQMILEGVKKQGSVKSQVSNASRQSRYRPAGSHVTLDKMQGLASDLHTTQVKAEGIELRIKEIKSKQKAKMIQEMYEVLIDPEQKKIWYDQVQYEAQSNQESLFLSTLIYKRSEAFKKIMKKFKNEREIKGNQSIIKFQKRINQMIISFKNLKKFYSIDDLHRIMRIARDKNQEDYQHSLMQFQKSVFQDDKNFVAQELSRASLFTFFIPNQLYDNINPTILENLVNQLSPTLNGQVQSNSFEAIKSLCRLKNQRHALKNFFQKIFDLQKQNLLYNSSQLAFIEFLSEISMHYDLDVTSLVPFLVQFMNKQVSTSSAKQILSIVAPHKVKSVLDEIDIATYESSEKEASKDNSLEQSVSQSKMGQDLTEENKQKQLQKQTSRKRATLNHFGLSRTTTKNENMIKQRRMTSMHKGMIDLDKEKKQEVHILEQTLNNCNIQRIQAAAIRGLNLITLPFRKSDFTFFEIDQNQYVDRQNLFDSLVDQGILEHVFKNIRAIEEIENIRNLLMIITSCVISNKHVEYIMSKGLIQLIMDLAAIKDPFIQNHVA